MGEGGGARGRGDARVARERVERGRVRGVQRSERQMDGSLRWRCVAKGSGATESEGNERGASDPK